MLERLIQQLDFADDYKEFWLDIIKKSCLELYDNVDNSYTVYKNNSDKIYNDINKMLKVVPITLRKLIDEMFIKEHGEVKGD